MKKIFKKIKRYIKALLKILKKPEMSILPASIAFYLVLAIIPFFTVLVLIASSVGVSLDTVTDLVNKILPTQIGEIIVSVISGKGFDKSVGFFNIIAFLLATNGTYSIINASNTLYKVENRDLLKDRIKSVLILFIIVILFLFMILVPIFGDKILLLLKTNALFNNIIDEIIFIFNIIKWPITFIIIYFNLKLIYTISPNKQILSYNTTYGSLFTTLSWIIATAIFSYYLKYFARYDIIYGNLSSIIILMMWTYILSFVFVLGMTINVTKYNEIEETKEINLNKIKEKVNTKKGIQE